MKQKNIQIVEISGAPYERGFQYGQAVNEMIHKAVKDWKLALHRNHLLDPEDYIKSFLAYENFKTAIENHAPGMLDEVRGIADGAQIDFDTMYAFQLADEEWTYGVKELLWKKKNGNQLDKIGQNCSTLGIYGQKDSPSYLAQNMDTPAWTRKYPILLKINYDGFQVICLTYPGLIAMAGLNTSGTGICCNTLFNLNHCQNGLPIAFAVRRALEMQSFTKTVDFIKSVKYASGQNFTIGCKKKISAFECSANKVVQYVPDRKMSRVFHTNHAIVNDDNSFFKKYKSQKSADFQASGPDNSQLRYSALDKRLGKHIDKVSINDIKAALRSHDDPHNTVCVDTPTVLTFASIIYEFGKNPKLQITQGPPCRSKYESILF